ISRAQSTRSFALWRRPEHALNPSHSHIRNTDSPPTTLLPLPRSVRIWLDTTVYATEYAPKRKHSKRYITTLEERAWGTKYEDESCSEHSHYHPDTTMRITEKRKK